jgi:bacterioferritin
VGFTHGEPPDIIAATGGRPSPIGETHRVGRKTMKGNAKLIEALNQRLAEELTAVNQYMVHAEMCANWGYDKLHKAIERQAIDEMHHAEWLIQRIIFLDGAPIVSRLNAMKIGKTVPEMVANDEQDELGAVKAYNETIKLADEVGDKATSDLLTKILRMEEGHVDWAETQRVQIEHMGLENFLAMQTGEGKSG